MLITFSRASPAYVMPSIAALHQQASTSHTVTGTSVTPGATPTTPVPLRCAPTIPATCVPWNAVSTHGFGTALVEIGDSGTETCPLAQSTLVTPPSVPVLLKSTCVLSMPLSRIPTLTAGEPASFACASGERMRDMFHCSFSIGSAGPADLPPFFLVCCGGASCLTPLSRLTESITA